MLKLSKKINNKWKAALILAQLAIVRILFKRKSFFIKPNTLLLLKLDSIGDYILFRNFIQLLKTSDKYKNYTITLCGNTWWKELSEHLDTGYIDEFIWVDYAKLNTFSYQLKLIRELHSKAYEVLIHPTYSRDPFSDNVAIHSGAKYKIGYEGDLVNITKIQKDKNNLSYTTLVPSSSPFLFEFYRNRYFFEQVLMEKITLSKPELNYHSVVSGNKIIICPGAKDSFRRWSPQQFAELCNKLNTNFENNEFVICGSQADNAAATAIMINSGINFTNYVGKLSLVELLQLFTKARLIITNDSGPFHIAVALNKKVVCISNGNNYGRFTPYPAEMNTLSTVVYPEQLLQLNNEQRLIQYYKHGSPLNITNISVNAVYDAIKNKLLL
jgi:ADP-heptose:LPS heptosyltransferase